MEMADPSQEVEVRDEQGRLTGRFEMAGGELHGLSTLYGGGRTIAEIGYANGLRHGEMRCYGEDGQLSSAVPHAGGVPHGEASFFHPGGGLARLAHYKDGRLHGEVRDFGLDGKETGVGHLSAAHGRVHLAGQGVDFFGRRPDLKVCARGHVYLICGHQNRRFW